MKKKLISYKDSGVNIALGNKFVKHINTLTGNNVKKGRKFNNIGSFGSLYEISKLKISNICKIKIIINFHSTDSTE